MIDMCLTQDVVDAVACAHRRQPELVTQEMVLRAAYKLMAGPRAAAPDDRNGATLDTSTEAQSGSGEMAHVGNCAHSWSSKGYCRNATSLGSEALSGLEYSDDSYHLGEDDATSSDSYWQPADLKQQLGDGSKVAALQQQLVDTIEALRCRTCNSRFTGPGPVTEDEQQGPATRVIDNEEAPVESVTDDEPALALGVKNYFSPLLCPGQKFRHILTSGYGYRAQVSEVVFSDKHFASCLTETSLNGQVVFSCRKGNQMTRFSRKFPTPEMAARAADILVCCRFALAYYVVHRQ